MSKENKPKHRTKDWKKFFEVESPSINKSKKRSAMGLCIGCGKNPCACKNPQSRRAKRDVRVERT